MTSRLSSSSFPILELVTTIFFVLASVHITHAEANKISLLSTGTDKALFFLALVILLTLIGGIIALIRLAYKKTTESRLADVPQFHPLFFLVIIGLLLLLFIESL